MNWVHLNTGHGWFAMFVSSPPVLERTVHPCKKWFGGVRSISGTGIMEADDRQVTTVFTVQPSFHHLLSTHDRRRTCSHTSPRRSPTIITLHDTGFVECRWWNDSWTVKLTLDGRRPPLYRPLGFWRMRRRCRCLTLADGILC